VVLEIGFGNGESLVEQAQLHPQLNYPGIEVNMPGVGHCLMHIQDQNVSNIRLMTHDAIDVLQNRLADCALARLNLYFPDPWPKKRHHKRRLVQADFVKLVASRLKPGGDFHLATDWRNYAEQMLAVLEAEDAFGNLAGQGNFCERGADRPTTKFERRGQRLGHEVLDLRFERRAWA